MNISKQTVIGLIMLLAGSGSAMAVTDATQGSVPAAIAANTSVDPGNNIAVAGMLDNFNRPDGPLGANWTDQALGMGIVANAAKGGLRALSTYNGATSTVVEADVSSNNVSGIKYVALVLDYLDINNNLFFKIQSNLGGTVFDRGFCYLGNGGTMLQFYDLTTPFSTAHMKVEKVGADVTITYSNIDGGPGTQTYTCAGMPATGGTGIGIAAYNNLASIDNFSTGGGPVVTISPASGSLLTTQKVDVALAVEGGVGTLVSATFDGKPITGFFGGCLVPGTLIPPSPTGSTLTCPGLRGSQMGPGAHTFSVTVDVGGATATSSVNWNVLSATQP